jgi:predicted 3-demethylubiquinone-9 3-methyltransferase (glyoxalase superfamily)
LNGGPEHQFNEAISFFIHCKDQAEIDYYWSKLTDGGAEIACGWLKDRFGVRWQVVPESIMDLVNNPAAMQAMMTMKKLDIAALKAASKQS